VTALVEPKNLGYAEIAGIPIQPGLYAATALADRLSELNQQPSIKLQTIALDFEVGNLIVSQ